MSKYLILLFLLASLTNVFGQSDNAAQAKSFIDALAKKDFAAAENYFSDDVKKQLPAEKLTEIWTSLGAQFGDFKSQGKVSRTKQDGVEIIVTDCEFEKQNLNVQTVFDSQGKIVGLLFAPSQTTSASAARYAAPDYADSNAFEESEVTVGSGEWALPATLTMPKGKTNVPAIVLVHGSGPNDRDATHTNPANKVFKDLAWGLASRGIAVLRYEKRTRQYGTKLAAKGFTVNEETVDDALYAAETLRQTPNVNTKKIFVLGHSLGGMMIPRIAERDKNLAGLIVFAGTARPLEDVIVEQNEYFSSLSGAPSADTEKQLAALKTLAEKTKNLKATDVPPTLLDLPVAYWVDLNTYNPAQIARKLSNPMLILQGESDYQVTMKDFALWKDALGERKNVSFKTYPNITHTFMQGAGGKPSPKDYEKTAHVERQVVNDIADWILKQ